MTASQILTLNYHFGISLGVLVMIFAVYSVLAWMANQARKWWVK